MARGTTSPRVALTREAADNAGLAAALAKAGLMAISCPLVRVDFLAPSEVTLARSHYEWLAATSRRALVWLDWRRGMPNAPTFGRAACVGQATAEYARSVLKLDPLVPETKTAQALAEAMGDVRGQQVLFPRGELARETLAQALRAKGAIVDDPVVYHTRPDNTGVAKLKALIAARDIDAVVFASPSAVNFAVAGGADLSRVHCFSIGPTTSDALRAQGVAVAAEAHTPDEQGLLAAILKPESP